MQNVVKPVRSVAIGGHVRSLARRCRKQAAHEWAERKALLEAIADEVGGCRPSSRCHNAACPRCNRRLQAQFVATAKKAVEKKAQGRDLAVVSIIPTLRLTIGASIPHLKEQVTRVLTELRRGIEAAGVKFLVGGIDLSVNENRRGRKLADDPAAGKITSRIQLHLWGIGLAHELEAAKPALREAFPRTRDTFRPIRVQPFDGSDAGYAYALKPNFSRRISLPPSGKDKGAKRSSRNTRLKKLTVPQDAEIAMILNVLEVRRRVFVMGVRARAGEGGRLSLEVSERKATAGGGGSPGYVSGQR